MDANRTAAAQTAAAQPPVRRAEADSRPRGADGDSFVLRSGIPWNMLPKEMGCGSGSTCWRRLVRWQRAGVWKRLHRGACSPNCAGAASSIWRAPSSTAPRSARCAGEKNWTEPYRSPQGRVETSCSYRRARDSARRAADGGEPPRRDPVAAARRRDAAVARAARPAGAQTRRSSKATAATTRSRIATSSAQRGIAPQLAKRGTAARQRPRPHALGRRAHPRLAASISPTGRALRTASLRSRSVSHLGVRLGVLVLSQAGQLILQRALRI